MNQLAVLFCKNKLKVALTTKNNITKKISFQQEIQNYIHYTLCNKTLQLLPKTGAPLLGDTGSRV